MDADIVKPDDLRIIFNHVPKAGGSSINRMFVDIFGEDKWFRHRARNPKTDQFSPAIGTLSTEELSEFRFITGHFEYGNHRRLPGFAVKYIGAIRDPFDLLVSDYFYNQERGSAKNKALASSLSFEQYVQQKLDNPKSTMVLSHQIKRLTGTFDLDEAKRIVTEEYLVCATTPQLNEMQKWLADYFGRPDLSPKHVNVLRVHGGDS